MLAVGSHRLDVPVGQVPDYRTFCRFVWQYRDEEGQSVIHPPPWMYSLIIDDPVDVSSINAIVAAFSFDNPASAKSINVAKFEGGVRLSFANLGALHSALASLARCGVESENMKSLAEFLLWTLGFRWV